MPPNSCFTLTGPSPLGALTFLRMQGSAALSAPFDLTIDFLADGQSFSMKDMLGQDMSLSILLPDAAHIEGAKTHSASTGGTGGDAVRRVWNGIITQVLQQAFDDRIDTVGRCFQVRLEPRFALLRLSQTTRFFHGQTVPEVVKSVLTSYAIDYDFVAVTGTYPEMEHCTQYRETDFDFVNRLLEREGIHYLFDHQVDKHTLILSDGVPALPALGHYGAPVFRTLTQNGMRREGIYQWIPSGVMTNSRVTLNAYDFEKPSSSRQQHLKSLALRNNGLDDARAGNLHDKMQSNDFVTLEEGDRYAMIGAQCAFIDHTFADGSGEIWGLNPGAAFTLSHHPVAACNIAYRVISARWRIEGDSAANTGEKAQCHCDFRVIGSDVPFRAARRTAVPRTAGPQTCFVVGPKVDQVHTDQYGRIKVAFHWEGLADAQAAKGTDGAGSADSAGGSGTDNTGNAEGASASDDGGQRCWVRVVQAWAGKQWGSLFLPRVGQEVMVDFLGGNPDYPIVTGSVYNASTMPPFALPANASIATLRSQSLAENGGSNELRFVDEAGKEQLFMRAEKDFETYIKHDALTWIGGDRHRVVTGDQAIEIDGKHSEIVKGDAAQSVGGKLSQTVTDAIHIKTQSDYAVDSAGDVHLKAAGSLVIEAGKSITLQVGGAFIVIASGVVSVTGAPIELNSGGSAVAGVGSAPATPATPLLADDGTKKLAKS